MRTAADQLKTLYQELEAVAAQLPLASQANDIVPGEGNPEAEVFFIGEAPGYHESVQRRPFVGRSGKLLRTTIEKVGLSISEVYIGNIVKARPPDNRDPSSEEIVAYQQYLDSELSIIDPTLIVTLGRFSMAKFLPGVRISQVHGRVHKVTIQNHLKFVLPMYHPAAALRGSTVKAAFEADMAKIPKVLAWIHQNSGDYQLQQQVAEALF